VWGRKHKRGRAAIEGTATPGTGPAAEPAAGPASEPAASSAPEPEPEHNPDPPSRRSLAVALDPGLDGGDRPVLDAMQRVEILGELIEQRRTGRITEAEYLSAKARIFDAGSTTGE